jgi:hypothetical protein
MAKRKTASDSRSGAGSRSGSGGRSESGAGRRASGAQGSEDRIGKYAEELGRMLGTLRARVDTWTGDREQLITQLSTVVDDAQSLLADLGHRAQRSVQALAATARGKRRAPGKGRRKSGKLPKGMAGGPDRKTHTLPATARRKMGDKRSG